MSSMPPLRVGARRSTLSRVQTDTAIQMLERSCGLMARFIGIDTSGDKIQDRTLSEIGGKALFSKELDTALLEEKIDIAVHSVKDLESPLHERLTLAAILPRGDSRDGFVSFTAKNITALPKGSVFGTSSPRRQAQILRYRPDLTVTLLRGNVETRLKKLQSGKIAATLMAAIGIERLGISCPISLLEHDVILPAVAQGAIGLVTRKNQPALINQLQTINHKESEICISCERMFLEALGASCRSPVAAHASLYDGLLTLKAQLFHPENAETLSFCETGRPEDALPLGKKAGHYLYEKASHFPNYVFAHAQS